MNWDDYASFTLLPVQSEVDVRVVTQREIIDLQFTLAAPNWGRGYRQHEIRQALNDCKIVSGYPPYKIEGGIAFGDNAVLEGSKRWEACVRGLEQALVNKLSQDGRGCVLAVYAEEFYFHLLELKDFNELCSEVLRRLALNFKSIWIFDHQAGFIFRSG
jgi:hypothetical protein